MPNTNNTPTESVFEIKSRFVNRAEGEVKVATLDIEGPIGFDFEKYREDEDQNDGRTIKKRLEAIDQDVAEIKVNILNSPGGDIFEGIAIHDFLAQHSAKVTIEVTGFAASIATVIMQAGDVRKMSSNASVLVHEGMIPMCGFYNSQELASASDEIGRMTRQVMSVYEKRGVDMEKASPFINADNGNGKWIYPDEAKDMGLVDEVYEPFKAVAFKPIDGSMYASMKQRFGLPELPVARKNKKEPEQAVNTNQEEESIMTPEEIQALVESTVTSVMAALKPQAIEAPKEAPEAPKEAAMTVEFEGEFDNAEHIEAHTMKLKKAELYNATDFSNIDSVVKYQNALEKLANPSPEVPKLVVSNNALNATPVKNSTSQADENRADTLAAFGLKGDK